MFLPIPLLTNEPFLNDLHLFVSHFISAIISIIFLIKMAAYCPQCHTREGRSEIEFSVACLIFALLLFVFGLWAIFIPITFILVGAGISLYSLTQPIKD